MCVCVFHTCRTRGIFGLVCYATIGKMGLCFQYLLDNEALLTRLLTTKHIEGKPQGTMVPCGFPSGYHCTLGEVRTETLKKGVSKATVVVEL